MELFKYDHFKQKTEEIFNLLISEIKGVLPDARIEHIGSSSIPNSLSKGDLDIFVGVPNHTHEQAINAIKTIGFTEKEGTFRSHELCMLVTNKFNYDVAIQVVANDSEFECFIRFRDILKENESLVEEYNNLKLKAQILSEDKYREKKSEFIQHVLAMPLIKKA